MRMINDRATDRSVLASLVEEIKHLRSLRTSIFTHIHRSQNVVSDYLAKYARTENRSVVWLNSGLSEVIELCNIDRDIIT